MEGKKKKRLGNMRFVVYGLLFALLLALPITHAQGIISGTSANAFEQAFGGSGLFVFFFFIIVAFIEGFFHIPWAIAIEMYLVAFATVTVLLSSIFSFQILAIIWVLVFSAAGYGFTKVFADLIFA